MARTHDRSQSPAPASIDPHGHESALKRLKTTHTPTADAPPVAFCPSAALPAPAECDAAHFADGLLNPSTVQTLRAAYAASEPFKHAVLDKLVQEELLLGVKDECLKQLSFTLKETDIYKVRPAPPPHKFEILTPLPQVRQTGDLASLSYISPAELARLPSLLTLRDALYSPTFRAFLRAVTRCGPLSGTKRDMSVNSYTRGCHLLNHDDVIGTRRVSYILYLPLPHPSPTPWKQEWGGALELYPVRSGTGEGAGTGAAEPEPVPSKRIVPAWNQFVFFEVQPGKSFHSVEEVCVPEGKDGRARMSISGWFHAAQEGEEGYEGEIIPAAKSSREQLVSAPIPLPPTHANRQTQTSAPPTPYASYPETQHPPLPSTPLTPAHISFLAEFLNPVYLHPRTLSALAARFAAESSLELHTFLAAPLAAKIEGGLRAADEADGLGLGRRTSSRGARGDGDGGGHFMRVPDHAAGVGAGGAWVTKGPPHKWRYCVLKPHVYGPHEEARPGGDNDSHGNGNAASPGTDPGGDHTRMDTIMAGTAGAGGEGTPPQASSDELMRSLQDELFKSNAFRAWLAIVSRLLPLRYAVEGRRFRPGLDYTLATSEEREVRLDVVLGLTPDVVPRGRGGHASGIGHASGSVGGNGNGHAGGNGNGNGHGHGGNGNGGGKGKTRNKPRGWATGEWGGWEVSLSPFTSHFLPHNS